MRSGGLQTSLNTTLFCSSKGEACTTDGHIGEPVTSVEVVETPSLEMLKKQVDVALQNMVK